MSRLVSAGENVGPTIERVVAVVTVASGVVIVPLVAATPAWVPSLLGTQWADVVPVIPPAALHLMVMGPLTVAFIGYLWAVGEASAVLRATLAGILRWGSSWSPLDGHRRSGSGIRLARLRCRRSNDAHDVRSEACAFHDRTPMIPPTILAVFAASAGWLVSRGAVIPRSRDSRGRSPESCSTWPCCGQHIELPARQRSRLGARLARGSSETRHR